MNRWAYVYGVSICTVIEQDTTPSVVLDPWPNGFWVQCPDWVGPDCVYENGEFLKIPPPPLLPIITKVAFISRFTPQEYVGVVAATKTDVEVQAWYDLFQAANVVDLSDPRTIAGVNSFVTKGLLTQERANAILTDPVQDNERP